MKPFKRTRQLLGLATLLLSLMLSMPGVAAEQSIDTGKFDPDQVRDIEKIAHDYLLSHPEIMVEALQKLQAQEHAAAEDKLREAAGRVKPVTNKDHVLGDPRAPVKVVEFSDFECPFCKRVHPTLQRLMNEYGETGKVALVYRHFPLDALHKKARKEAQASECANELGGNRAFWAYADRLFEITPSNDGLDLSLLPKLAKDIGLDRGKFETCLSGDARGGKYADHIEADVQDAIASGGEGTPYIVVIAPDGETFPISGAQPYSAFKSIVDLALAKK